MLGTRSAEQREGRCTASGTRWPWRFLDSIFKQQRRYESLTPRRDTPELCIYLSPPWRATGEAKYFCKGGWTPLSTRRPTGKSLEPALLPTPSAIAPVQHNGRRYQQV